MAGDALPERVSSLLLYGVHYGVIARRRSRCPEGNPRRGRGNLLVQVAHWRIVSRHSRASGNPWGSPSPLTGEGRGRDGGFAEHAPHPSSGVPVQRDARPAREGEVFPIRPCRVSPRRASHFSCFAKKSNQKKATPRRRRLRRFPPVLGKAGRPLNSLPAVAQT